MMNPKTMLVACLLAILFSSGTTLTAQQPESEIAVVDPGFGTFRASLPENLLIPATDSTELIGSRVYLSHAAFQEDEPRPWKRYALVGAAVGAVSAMAYYRFAIRSDPENRLVDSEIPPWIGYAGYAIPGALVGGLVGASLAYR